MRIRQYYTVFVVLFWFNPISVFAQDSQSTKVYAHIKIDSSQTSMQLESYCRNNAFQSDQFRYKFVANKSGKSGNSKSSQSGKFTLNTGQRKSLATVHLNVVPGDTITADLTVFSDSVKVAEDHIHFRLK